MLRTRVITAIILLLVLLPAVFWLPEPGWVVFTLAIALVALWEWTRIAPLTGAAGAVFLGLSAVAAAVFGYAFIAHPYSPTLTPAYWLAQTGFTLSALFWFLVAPWWIRSHWRIANPWLLGLVGWIVVFPTAFALIVHRQTGPWFLIALMAIVWVADIAAYFAGKRFGRHKLAPAVSPGKTWEGVAGALLGVSLYAAGCVMLIGHLQNGSVGAALPMLPGFVLLFVVLAALAIVGDLFESWMKRGVGVKDSSNLLPGHGGVLDRIDALTSTLAVAPLLAYPMHDLLRMLETASR